MEPILEVRNITKRYPGVVALDDVSLSFEKGEIHAIMGENGAGKSTLIKIIAGAEAPTQGSIEIGGASYPRMHPMDAKKAGISVIYQEFNLIPSMSVAENLFIGEKVGKSRYLPDFKEMYKRAADFLSELGSNIKPETLVFELSTSQKQLVEIAKAMVQNCKVLIMDEPSAAISVAEVDNMLRIVRELKEKGVTIIYISHRIDEVFGLCDRISILRDGKYVTTGFLKDMTRKDLIRHMVGRELSETYPHTRGEGKELVLSTEDLSGNGDFHIDMNLRAGEILGVAGLVGAGRTELAKMLCGDVRPLSGNIYVKGTKKNFKTVSDALDSGIGLIPEDRKGEGLFMDYSVDWNIPSMCFKRLAKWGIVKQKDAEALTDEYVKALRIKTPSTRQVVRLLSGGNQQKVVVARALAYRADILIFDEPTRGIDVGTKQEIYKLMDALASDGKAIIMITSDMEELLGMSDRIIVLYEGRKTGELLRSEFNQDAVLSYASGYTGD
ncbi:MAG: sugar ABC transporter ATP-binding protein [Lachnospiraceae bacterium]|jgi:ABC-type sugar transport system ATPase subunit|nr:sugar ABC transporter ATP-binding protein [Lachnospiraceae bacterium]